MPAQVLVTPSTQAVMGAVQVKIHIDTALNISASAAQRQVTTYLIDYVSDHLGGERPTLVIDNDQLFWRVPVALFLTSRGRIGQVGTIDVDGQTGELQLLPTTLTDIKAHADYLATRSAS